MAKANYGFTVNVSAEALEQKLSETSVSFERSLTVAQKALKVQIDDTKRLVNANGRLVEGLSIAQIRAGQYVDELGRIHLANGGLVADLSKIEIGLGYYADEFGAVYDRENNFVRLTREARDEIAQKRKEIDKAAEAQRKAASEALRIAEREKERADREAERAAESARRAVAEKLEATQRARAALSESLGTLSSSASQFGVLLATLKGTDERSDSLRNRLIMLSQGASMTFATLQTGFNVARAYTEGQKSLGKVLAVFPEKISAAGRAVGGFAKQSTTASVAVRLLSAALSPVGLVLTAIGAGFSALLLSGHKSSSAVEGLEDVEKAARKAGDKVTTLAKALEFGAFNPNQSKIRMAVDELKRIEERNLTSEQEQALEESWTAVSRAINRAGFAIDNFLNRSPLEKAKKEQYAAINEYAAQIVERNKTEAEKIQAEIDDIKAIMESATLNGDQWRTFSDEIARLSQRRAEAIKRETQEAERAAQEAREANLKALGISEYLDAAAKKTETIPPTLEDFSKTVEKWNAAVEEGTLAQEDANTATTELKEKIKAALGSELGVSFQKSASAEEQLAVTIAKLQESYLKQITSSEEKDAAIEDAIGKYVDALSNEDASAAAGALRQAFAGLQGEITELDIVAPIENLLAAVQKKADEAKAEAQKNEAERLAASQGIDLTTAPTTGIENAFDAELALAEWEDKLAQGTISSEQFAKAQGALTAKIEELQSGYAEKLGLSQLEEAAKEYERAATSATEALDKQAESFRKALADGDISQEQYARAKAAIDAIKPGKKAEELGLGALTSKAAQIDSANTSEYDALRKKYKDLLDAYKRGEVAEEKMNEATEAWRKIRADRARQEKEAQEQAKKQERDDLRSKLGVDSVMEARKSPWEKYQETMDYIAEAAKKKAVSAIEQIALEEDAYAKLTEALDQHTENVEGEMESFYDKADSVERLGDSLRAGSAELYMAQVKNSTSYQAKIETRTAQIGKTLEASLRQSQTTNALLSDMAQGAPTFFGV